jgi:predicted dehydrogenase
VVAYSMETLASIHQSDNRVERAVANRVSPLRIAIVGCGYVADLYLGTLPQHPELALVGVMDRHSERSTRFSAHHGVREYPSLDAVLDDPSVDAVLNLTNPCSHFAVSKACLESGKHVYSEKPLAMDLDEAKRLVEIAGKRGLYLSSAPCNLLGETAQTVWKALREGAVGTVRVVYAELDDGMVHQTQYRRWISESGTPWPYKDEFEVGCTLEHAGYYVTWLAAFFGPAESVTALSSCQIPDKQTDIPLDIQSPDFSVACIRFTSGIVARLTCGIIAPHDHSLTIIGDKGVLCTDDCWNFHSRVYSRRLMTIRRKTFLSPWKKRHPLVQAPGNRVRRRGAAQMDFCRGVQEMAEAIAESRPSRLSPEFCLHVNEIVLAIQNAGSHGGTYRMSTTFNGIAPMPWGR